MKVKAYNTSKYHGTTTYDVTKIEAMPPPNEITDEDMACADGIMLTLHLRGNRTVFIPHSFLIEVTPD